MKTLSQNRADVEEPLYPGVTVDPPALARRLDRMDRAFDVLHRQATRQNNAIEAIASEILELGATAADAIARLERIEPRVEKSEPLLMDVLSRLQRRRDPAEATKRQHVQVVERYYEGHCPCCREALIVREGSKIAGAFDHWTDNPARNGAHETWLICEPCNRAFQSGKLDRDRCRMEFDYFQRLRRRQGGDNGPAPLLALVE